MPKISSEKFRELLENDGYTYVLTSKCSEPIDINFPNMPDHHRDEFEEWRHEILPEATVIRFEYKGLNYKLLSNLGDADCKIIIIYYENKIKLNLNKKFPLIKVMMGALELYSMVIMTKHLI